MPKIEANGITMNYHQEGTGQPLVLIPYLAADHACYAFQMAAYASHFTCFTLDLRGTGETDDPGGEYTTETVADDVAAFMQAAGIERAHVSGFSFGAAVGMWLAARHPQKVRSLSLHAGWPRTDPFIKAVVESWRVMARALDSVQEMTVQGIFPWCFTPELYGARPDYVDSLAAFVRGRPPQTVESFLRQSNAVLGHDAESQLRRIRAPTLITAGDRDQVTSTRFTQRMRAGLRHSELVVFEGCAHATLYEKVEEFNTRTLDFLKRQVGARAA